MSAGEQGKFRYLICTDASQVEAAASIAGKSYECISLESAQNGHLAEISGNPIVLWPTKETVAIARAWGRELAVFGEVKLLDVSKGFCPTPAEMVEGEWDFKQMLDWISGKTEHSTNIVELVTANEEYSEVIEPQDKPDKLRITNSASPDDNLPSVEVDPATDDSPDAYGSPADAPDGLGEAEPHWLRECPPDDDAGPPRPLSAEAAYIPYTEPETRSKVDGWPEPLDLTKTLYRGAPMPISLVPAALQPFVADNAARLGVNPGPVWFGVLGALAGLSSDSIRLQIKQNDDWKVHPSVWCLVLGGPSSGKTPALEVGMRWVQKKDAEKVIENMRKMDDYDHLMKQYEADCAVAVKNKAPRPEKPEMPVLTEYWLNNGTREGAVRMLQHSRKFCYFLDEASAFITALDRYAQGGKGSGDREFWLSTWNSGPSKVSLANRTISIPNSSAALCGGTTPSAMRSAAGGKLQADGLLARFLICNIPDKESGEDTTPDAQAAAMYDRILTNLIDMRHSATVKLSTDAAAIYREFCDDLTRRIRSEDSEDIGAAYGKWYGLWGRLALIYYLTDCAAHGHVPTDGATIPAGIAKQVTDFLRWQVGHQQQFYYEIMSNRAGRKFSQLIARFILAHDELDELNFRDHISRPHHKAMEALKPWELKEAINTLINAAWITPKGFKTNTHGVPGAYEINPRIRSMFEDERENEKERRAIIRDELQAMRGLREPGDD